MRKKSTLARKKDPGSKINVFDVEIGILDKDEKLKPGMSASCRVIMEQIPDVVKVPLEAVFEKEGRTVVYLDNKKEVEVKVGRRNDMEIEVTEGLREARRYVWSIRRCRIRPCRATKPRSRSLIRVAARRRLLRAADNGRADSAPRAAAVIRKRAHGLPAHSAHRFRLTRRS